MIFYLKIWKTLLRWKKNPDFFLNDFLLHFLNWLKSVLDENVENTAVFVVLEGPYRDPTDIIKISKNYNRVL